ncbi:hypothetical protein HPT25_23525 [Bacillus sp. BRMEA1]|uniref:phage terminase small subunit n=1 Tax=Neobacillus endophyticus TaxID=2738405 RepID=UPI001564D8E9|nr:phage terminase small subunit [Neobacillus endophyticus]NRD80296.1 hypothetical protein [Neobacillus endophyticus]
MNWDEIRKEYESSDITLNALAEKYDVKIGTLKSRKSREGWSRGSPKKDATKNKKVATIQKDATSKKPINRGGNPNPVKKFTKRNQAAVKHGFFAKFLPAETLEIMESMNERSTADLIWDQIQIQYAAIIRAQQIMFVRDQDDMTREIKKEKSSMNGEETEYEIQFAWDKHATFLNAQSRAMSELRSLIKQFNELAHEDDERRLKLEQMQMGIEKTKAEIARVKGDPEEEFEDDGFLDALNGKVSEVWGDDKA